MDIATNTFWQANFWGIVGTASGTLGLLISWLNWRYSKPSISIAELILITTPPARIKDWFNGKSEQQLESHSLKYELKIRLRNKKGGAGSIEKPYLVITIPGKSRSLFKRNDEIKLRPLTTHVERTQISPSSYNSEIIRHGEAWHFNGGEIIDDELEYWTRDTSDLFKIVSNYDDLKYFIEYHNNFGRKYREKIQIFEED